MASAGWGLGSAGSSSQMLPANEPERTWPPPGMDDPEEQAAWWVAEVTGRKQPEGTSFQAWLKDGVALCELINAIAPEEKLR